MAHYIPNLSTSDSKNGIPVPSNAKPAFKLLKRIIVCLLLTVVVGSVSGATKTWDGGGNNDNWNTPNNWNNNTLPLTGDDIVIPNGYDVTVNTAAVCASLTINDGWSPNTITISGSNSLAVSGDVTIGAGVGKDDNKIIAVGAGTFSCGSITVAATGNGNISSGVTVSTGTITVNGNITLGDSNDDFTFLGAGTLNVGGNMSGGTFTASTGTVNYNGGAQTIGAYTYYNLTSSGSGTKTLSAATTVNGTLTVYAGSILALSTFTLGAPTSLVMDGGATTGASITGSGTLTLGGNVTINNATTGTNGAIISCPVALGGTRTFTVADDGSSAIDLTLSGVISTAYGITKTGTGSMTLSGLDTYTGSTTINSGTLVLNYVTSYASSTTTVNSPGILELTSVNTTVDNWRLNTILAGNGTINKTGIGWIQTFTNAHTFSGTFNITAGTFGTSYLSSDWTNVTADFNISAGALLDARGQTITLGSLNGAGNVGTTWSTAATVNIGTGNKSGTFTGIINGNGSSGTNITSNPNGSVLSLVKIGTGTQTLSGANTYSGLTTISAGTIKLGAAGGSTNTPLGTTGTGTSVSIGGVLDLNGFTLGTFEPLTLNGTGISNGGALINSSSTAATFAGLITLGSASRINGGAGTINISNIGTISGATFGLTLGGATGGILASILGTTSGTLTKQDTGTWTLSGVNTFTGGLIINSGIIQLSAFNSLSNSLPITLNGGTFGTGATTGSGDMVSTLALTDNSTIALGTGLHTFTFADSHSISWTAGKTLTIIGWSGSYNGTTGTEGKLFIGTTSSGLSTTQLSQIQFKDAGNNLFPAIQLSTGEVVPTQSLATDNFRSRLTGNWSTASNWQSSQDNLNWITASQAPTNAAASITIQSSNIITVDVNNQTASSITIASGGTLAAAGSNTLLVNGDWTNNGTFTPNTSTINLTGNNASNINGSAKTPFNNLTISKGAASTTVTSTSKAFSVGGGLTVTQGNLVLQAVDADYTVTNDLIVSTNGTLTHSVNWSTGFLLKVGGNIAIDGNFVYTAAVRSHIQMTGGGKTIKTGTSALSILTLANTTGTISANGPVTINDNFWACFVASGGTFATNGNTVTANAGLINAGGTVNINGGTLNVTGGLKVGSNGFTGNVTFSSGSLNADDITVGDGTNTGTFTQSGVGTANISGNLLINPSCSYSCTNSPTINITGNLTNNGTFTPSTSTVNMNGATQTITGTSASTFNNLTFSGTGTKTVGSAITTNGDLTVNSGITLSMSTYLLTLNGNLINNGTISGTTGGVSITGTVTQNIGAFTTTGTVSMTKTAGTATLTGNINGTGLTVNGTGGTLNLGSGTGHTFTLATITSGTITFGAANALPNALPFNLSGGTLKTGTTTGYPETIGNLNVTANSTIALGTGSHALNFAASNSVNWTNGTWLTITNWIGGYNGTSGTAGKIYFGTTNSGLTSSQLGQILFYYGTNYYTATQLSTGEVVPTSTIFAPTLTYTSPITFVINTPITPLSPTINVTPTGYSVSSLPAGLSINASTGIISGTPTGSASGPSTYTVTATTTFGNKTFPIIITTRVANTYYSRTTGDWNINTTWSTSTGGSPVASGYPLAGDFVNIQGNDNVTVTANAACSSLTFTGKNGTLTVNPTFTLNVSGAITLNSNFNDNYSNTITGAGNLLCSSLTIGTTVNSTSNRTTSLTTSIANLLISGDLTLYSYYYTNNSRRNNATLNLSSGIITVNGSVRAINNNSSNTSTLTMATGTQNGTLILGGATPFIKSGVGTTDFILSGTSTLVKYNYAGNQTVYYPATYNNLTLSGSGQKAISNTTTVNGILSLEGTATTTGTVPVAATLQYRGSAAQTTGIEFPATFSGSGGVIINNANGVTLNANSTISSSLTLINGKLTTTGHLLSVSNSSTSAISGGSTTTFINGPVKWTLPTNLVTVSTYNFPVGKNSTYLPFTLVNPTTGSITTPTAQVEAFDTGSGGSAGTGVTAISTNEYWKLSTTGSYTGSSVSISRPTAITPSTVIATSTSVNANTPYSNLGGTFDMYGVYGSNTTTNATTQYFVFATGNVPSMNVTTNILHGFSYSVGNGPSNELSFKVSGISLSGNITVTPSSSNYEISTVSGGIFQTTQLILTPVSGQVNATIYVREKAGLAVGNYASAITVASSTSQFTAKSVNCYGTVAPVITVSGGGSYCEGDDIYLTSSGVTNQYWTGPNNYYSILPNNTLTGTTTDFTGTYTVTGSITSNNNLIVNGNFSLGNNFFTSSYSYFTTKNMGETKYAVVPLPSDVHSNFCSNCGDHTSGTGNQMVVNGATTANVIIWGTSTGITVTPYTNYQFTYFLQTVVKGNDPAPSKLQLYANGIAAGPTYIANDTTGIWTQFRYNWYSDSNTSVNLSLVNQQTAQNGNDFALDDIVFQQVYTSTATVNVTVLSINTPASVSVSASANPVNSGQSVTLTATPTNGGIAPTYQWSVGSGAPVTGSATFSYIPANGDVVTCTMTSNSNCYSGDPVSSSVTITVNTVKNLWIGTKSTNWGDAANWTAGFVPGTGDNVEFATTDNYTSQATNNLILDVDRTIGNLTNATINPIRQLIIPPARYLKVNGSIITPDTDPNRNYIQAQPDDTQQNGTLIFNNDPATPVYATVEMFAKGSFSAIGATYDGNTYHYSWQYFGIPINRVSASPTFDGSYVRSWYEPGTNMTNHWIPLTNDSILKPLYGYELTQDNTKMIVFQGQLVNWECKSSRLGKTNGSAFPGQWVLANPFTAAIDIKLIEWGNPTDMTGEVYLYNTGSYANWGNKNLNAGQYNVVTAGTAGTLDLPTQIPSMQGFLVQVTNPTSEAWVKIPYSAVVKNSNKQSTKGTFNVSSSQKVAIKIDVNGSSYSDKMWIFSDPICSRNFDIGWDGTKMFGNALSPQLYAIEHDGLYQIDCIDDLNNTELGFRPGEDMTYTFTFTHTNIFTKYAGLFLVDLVENKTIDITESGTTYSFVAESSPVTVNRFKIVTRYIEKDASDTNTLIKVFCSGNTVFVQNLGSLNGELVIYDMMGRYLKKASFGPYGVTAVQIGSVTGAYVVNASTSNERVSKRLIIGK